MSTDETRHIYDLTVNFESLSDAVAGEREYNWLCSAYGLLAALNRGAAVIEFELDGTIITANDNFLNAMGYRREEIVGRHHRIFMPPEEVKTPQYASFWRRLAQGEVFTAEFLRKTKSGADIWIQASYNPIRLPDGEIIKVVKVATDITQRKQVSMVTRDALQLLSTLRIAEISDKALEDIEQSSKAIQELAAMIEQIAGRSNLLGINAEIEASHAGEAGKGFSVVAGEMRRLSESSAKTAEDIREMIGKSASVIALGRDQISEVSGRVAGLIDDVVTMQQAADLDEDADHTAAAGAMQRLKSQFAA